MNPSVNDILIAFLLTTFAGLSTGIGSAIALFAKRTNTTFLSISLGFSAGVMIYVSFIEIIPKSRDALIEIYSESAAVTITTASFFAGILLIAIIDKLIPSSENPHEVKKVEDMNTRIANGDKKLMRMGVLTAIAIAIHNFPEGLATFIAVLTDLNLGIAIAVAIAIHNIPEGIAVSVPIYYATGSRKKAFWYSFLSGMAEPVGAMVGFLILMPFLTPALFGIVFASVAGIMVFISFDELLPAAREYGKHHYSIYGLLAGMAIMAISLLLFL